MSSLTMHRYKARHQPVKPRDGPIERRIQLEIEEAEERLKRLKQALAALNGASLEDADSDTEAEPTRVDLIAELLGEGRKRRIGSLQAWLREEHGQEVSRNELAVQLMRDGRFARLAKGWWTHMKRTGGESS